MSGRRLGGVAVAGSDSIFPSLGVNGVCLLSMGKLLLTSPMSNCFELFWFRIRYKVRYFSISF